MIDWEILVWLLPIVFMIHDFEEILFFKPWIKENGADLRKRFPFVANKMLPKAEKLSVSAFALAVFEEFILLSIITFTAIYFHYFYVWLAAFMAFSFHILIHFIQWIVIGKYIPAIITSALLSPYCILVFFTILKEKLFSWQELLLWSLAGIVLMIINLIFAHYLASKFNHKVEVP